MAKANDIAREDLRAWHHLQPTNVYTSNRQLQRLLTRLMPTARFQRAVSHFTHFGEVVAGPLDRAAKINNRPWNLPRLERWSDIGERQEAIEHHPTHADCGKSIYEDGRVIASYAESPANLHAQALFYLSSHVGEAGHNCPVACTAGIVKILSHIAPTALQECYLPGLLSADFEKRLDGAQFLTEVQGGSDVGANAVIAEPDGEAMGTTRWRIHGEKWFCSNADADLILMTARVGEEQKGTRGLGLFLVPRRLEDGQVNHFHLRRLKDKLGTRSMASAEIDFRGAVAYAMGEVTDGFRNVIEYVINTSRLYNTLGCTGIARRAHLVAWAYAHARRAFGHRIVDYPMVQEMLAQTRATSNVLLAGGLTLAAMTDRAEANTLSDAQRAFLRVATNLVKMRSCQHSHQVVLTAIETLGGNGAIESFSILPRLLRDNVVYENWEGTHNTLVAQTLRDFMRLGLHEGFLGELEALLSVNDSDLEKALQPAQRALTEAKAAIETLSTIQDPGFAGLKLKRHAERLADIFFAGSYARDIEAESETERRIQEVACLTFFCQTHLLEAAPTCDEVYAQRIATIAAMKD